MKTFTEEMAHIVVDSLEAAENPLFYSMFNSIESHPMYADVQDAYQILYDNNTRMIKKEAIAQVIMDTIINSSPDSITPEQARARRWWQKVFDYLASIFNKIFMDPYTRPRSLC